MDDFERQLKRFDLKPPIGGGKLKLGQHFNLGLGICETRFDEASSFYKLVRKQAVAFAKATDRMLLDAIIKRAKEAGVTDLYELDDEFIMTAILEKIEREEHEHAKSDRPGL